MRAPDQDVRDAVLASRGRNLAVEAGAGTGKTTLLVDRVLSLVASGTPLSRLAIITFTRRAAADLEGRLVRGLQEARARGESWASQALTDLPGATIGTTDSFCLALLTDFALESSAPAGFTLADEIAEDALREVAWGRFLAQSGEKEARLYAELRELGIRAAGLREIADGFLDHRDLPIAAGSGDALPDLIDVFAAALAPALALRSRCADPADLLAERVDELERDLRIARDVGGLAAERVLMARVRADKRYSLSRGRKENWGSAKGEVIASLDALEQAMKDWLRTRGAQRAAQIAEWLGRYVDEYARLKRERGLVDFRDLSLATRDLLRADEGARRQLAARWDAILLDEAQDSDPLQMEIAMLLAAAEPVPADSFDATLAPGRLFLVGDPKQSIYRFRRADIELYARARAAVARGGETPVIRANFRSHPDILAFVNRLFGGWMEPPPGETFQASYEALEPGITAEGAPTPRVALLLADPAVRDALRGRASRLDAIASAELEADAVVRAVRAVLGDDGRGAWTVRDGDGASRAARRKDIAILVRRTAAAENLLEALRRAGVAATSVGSRSFHEREEIQTLLTLLDAVIDPADAQARFAALRSPAFAVRDDDLVLRFGSDFEPWAAGVSPEAIDAERRLAELTEQARRLGPADFLEFLIEELALFPAFGFRPDGAARIESLRLVLESIPLLEGAGIDSLPDLVHWLRSRSSNAPLALGDLDAGDADAVSLLTIHKAKGLEFPIVILADLGGKSANPSPVVPDRSTQRIEFRLPRASEIESPGFPRAQEREAQRRTAEEVRLLYVAATRARDHLVLAWSEETNGFLAKSMLPERLGAEPGRIPSDPSWNFGIVRAADLPPRERAHGVHVVDVERALRSRAPVAAHDLFPADRPAALVTMERPQVLAATAVAAAACGVVVRDEGAMPSDRSVLDPRTYGILAHAALEAIDAASPESSVPNALDRALRRIDAPVANEDRARIERELTRVVRDPALIEIRERWTAERGAQREVPFLVPFGDDLLSGTIDVLLEEADGSLMLIDYKTGRTEMPAHRAQLALYAWAAESITGRTVREARLLFLAADPVRTVRIPGEELRREASVLLPAALTRG